MELEDDLFFADLSRQISLLIMDDDEDPVAISPSVSYQSYLQGFSGRNYPTAPSPFMYEQTCSRESKGTGVFIPRSSQPRRKNRPGRQSSYNGKAHRQHDNTRIVSQVSYNNSFKSKKG